MKHKYSYLKIVIPLIIIGIVGIVMFYFFNPKKAINLILPNLNELSHVHLDLKKDSALAKLSVVIENKMPYKMVIDTIHFMIKLNGTSIVTETIPVMINQSRYEKDTIEIPIHLSVNKIKKVMESIKGKDSTDLEANIYMVYSTIIGKEKFHFAKKIKMATLILPKIKILKVKRTKFNLKNKTSEGIIEVEIINLSKTNELQLDDINYHLEIKNTLRSEGVFYKTIIIKTNSNVRLDIPIIIKFTNPLKTTWKIITDDDISKYYLKVKSNIKVKNSKNINEIPLEVEASGNIELVK